LQVETLLHVGQVSNLSGSTLRQLMNRNFGEGYYNSNSLLETKQYSSSEVAEIVEAHSWVKCLSDHKLSLDLPYDLEASNILALSYVRDPVERFISRYFFHRHFEEVNCIAQQMSFRDFANAELVEQQCPKQTNSQIYFLNHGRSFTEMDVIHSAINTGKAFLFPIERFDESCICMERLFPRMFTDLSYVRANVSKRDATVSDEDREFALRYLKQDYPVWELSQQFMDKTLERVFDSTQEKDEALAEFQDRCSRRHHNFHPPRPKGTPAPDQSDQATNDAAKAESPVGKPAHSTPIAKKPDAAGEPN
jgi:hypothetical protein